AGGCGLVERAAVDAHVRGLDGILAALGMAGAPAAGPRDQPAYLRRFLWLRCQDEGWWEPAVAPRPGLAAGPPLRPGRHPDPRPRRARGPPPAAPRAPPPRGPPPPFPPPLPPPSPPTASSWAWARRNPRALAAGVSTSPTASTSRDISYATRSVSQSGAARTA